MNVLGHIYLEIVKFNGVEFKSKQLVLEEAKTKHKDRTLDEQKPARSSTQKLLRKHYASTWAAAGTPASSIATPTKRTTYPPTTAVSTATQTI